jgi:hypothetical protein
MPPTPPVYTHISPYNDGKDVGITVRACGPIIYFSQSTTGSRMGYVNTLYSTNLLPGTLNYFGLSPPNVLARGSAAQSVLSFARFKFNKFKLHYVATRGTNAGEIFAVGYVPDPTDPAIPAMASIRDILQFQPHAYTNVWNSMDFSIDSRLSQKDWFYLKQVNAPTEADVKLGFQGSMAFGFSNLVNETQGLLYAEVELNCVQPTHALVTPISSPEASSFYELKPQEEKKQQEDDDCEIIPKAKKKTF